MSDSLLRLSFHVVCRLQGPSHSLSSHIIVCPRYALTNLQACSFSQHAVAFLGSVTCLYRLYYIRLQAVGLRTWICLRKEVFPRALNPGPAPFFHPGIHPSASRRKQCSEFSALPHPWQQLRCKKPSPAHPPPTPALMILNHRASYRDP